MHPVRAVHFPLTATIVATVTVIALVFVGRSTVEACQIPVFRYALERWEPDLFEVTVYHRGALNDSETALVEKLKSKGVAWGGESLADLIVVPGDEDAHEDHEDKEDKQEEDKEGKTKAEDGKSFANFRIQTVDLASLKTDAFVPAKIRDLAADALPHLEVRFPPSSRLLAPPEFVPKPDAEGESDANSTAVRQPSPPMAIAVWGGPLTAGTVEALVDSPARREVCNRILKGDSVVWVLVESGEKSADDAAFKLLEAELKRLEGTLELPDAESIVNDAEFQPDTKVELKLSFSALRVSRKSPAEQIFIGMLDNIETDLAEFRGKPLAVPVFGRGRALYALVGDGIAPDTIEAACRELIGPCSCTVKDLNPGVDLLTSVDWNSEVKGDAAPAQPLPDLPGLSIIEIEAEPLDAPEAPDVASSVTSTGPEETRNVSRDVSSAKPTDSTRANVESVERPTTAVTAKPTGSEGSEGAQNDTVEERGVGAYALLIVFGLGALVAVVGTLVLRSRQRN